MVCLLCYNIFGKIKFPTNPHYPCFMSCSQFSSTSRSPAPRRSLLLASAAQRVVGALCVSAVLWLMTAWAMGVL